MIGRLPGAPPAGPHHWPYPGEENKPAEQRLPGAVRVTDKGKEHRGRAGITALAGALILNDNMPKRTDLKKILIIGSGPNII
ncbi:MAG: hypothetical protein Q7O12_02790, partial [Deltaproteobacteria bacterium]|nr:hypothetical protein [Deltaproteobacteria bacterium]